MDKKKIISVAIILAILAVMASIVVIPAAAWPAEPSYPASIYIDTIYPWDNYNGVSILLTPTGWLEGTYWSGAYMIAGYTISEYERLAGPWPYNKRSRLSIAAEIWFHCLYTNPTVDTIDMGFNEWWWD